MLNKVVEFILSSNYRIDGSTIFITGYIVDDIEFLDTLEDNNVFEAPIIEKTIGLSVDLELSVIRLASLGFYLDRSIFLSKYKYKEPLSDFYILELNIFNNDESQFLNKYKAIVNLIDAIQICSKHVFFEVDILNVILYSETRSLILPLFYDSISLENLKEETVSLIVTVSEVLIGSSSEKKLIFVNELYDFLSDFEEDRRFNSLIADFKKYFDKSSNSFQYYLRDFSFNKLKLELDGKALEYTQKIQGVINDSQTKLVAIPTAFVIVFSAFEFSDLLAVKNIVSIISMFIFAIILQLFLDNQFSILRFLSENVETYKQTFKENNLKIMSEKFVLVENELNKQKRRFKIVRFILWSIPIGLLLLWLFLLWNNRFNNPELNPSKNFFVVMI
jgi:hypothetical protein